MGKTDGILLIPVDQPPESFQNYIMSIETKLVPTEAGADLKAMIEHAFHGKPLDLEAARRVEERAEAIRKRLPLTNIAVDLILESRDEI